MSCVPWVSEEVLNVALPLTTEAVPSEVPPSKNSTLPMVVEGVTVAMRFSG